MKALRAKNLQLAGIELVLPTVLCIEGRQVKRARTTVTVGYATGYVDSIVGSVVAEWLSRHFHGRFSEQGRGAEGDLAAEAFYDKLTCALGSEAPFLAAIVSLHETGRAPLGAHQPLHSASQPHSGGHRHGNADMMSRFTNGAGFARWAFAGPIHAFINAKTGAAQVAFEPLPGGIELTSTDKIVLPSTKVSKRTNEATAWYGIGIPMRDPADIVLMLRNEISASRHAQARRAHV